MDLGEHTFIWPTFTWYKSKSLKLGICFAFLDAKKFIYLGNYVLGYFNFWKSVEHFITAFAYLVNNSKCKILRLDTL